MEHKHFNYCLVILGENFESLLCRIGEALKEGNSILCYYFCDRDGRQCAFPLADALYESGDFTIIKHLSASSPIYIDDAFEHKVIQVNNAACDKLFAKKISDIQRRFALASMTVISSFMEQMGFPTECIEEYLNDGSVYLYDGLYREKITENTYPEIKAAIDKLHGDVYAIIPDHFENAYCYLLWNPNNYPDQLTPLTNDYRFGKTSLLRCAVDKYEGEYVYVGVMTNAGGVWAIPNRIASMKRYKYQFISF